MGWDYESRIAYGITVNSRQVPGLKNQLKQFDTLLGYDTKFSLEGPGTLFVYLKSTYQTLHSDHGSYSFGYPDIEGDEFNPPRHPIIHEVEDIIAPCVTDDETQALEKIKNLCNSKENSVWIRHSYVEF